MTILSGNKKGAFLALQGMLGKPAYVPVWPVLSNSNAHAQYAINNASNLPAIPNTFSLSLWVRIDSYGPEETVVPIYMTSSTAFVLYLSPKIFNPNAWLINTNMIFTDGNGIQFNAPDNDIGSYHHIVFIFSNGASAVVYLDGSLVPSSSVPTSTSPALGHVFAIGAVTNNDPATSSDIVTSDMPIMGVISNVMVLLYELTGSQVSQIYKSGPSANTNDYKQFQPSSLYAVPENSPPKIMKDYGSFGVNLAFENGLSYAQTKGIGKPGLVIPGFDLGISIPQ